MRQRVVAGVLLLVGAVGCAPVASFRPASGIMKGKKVEVGGGATAVSPRPYVIEEWQGVGQVWVSGDINRVSNLSGIIVADDTAMAVGGAIRLTYLRADRFAGAVEGEIGYAFGAVSLPCALRLFDETWLYAAPRLGNWGLDAVFGVPAGASVRVVDGLMLRVEWQRSWQGFKYYNRRDHFGGAIAQQF